MPFLSNYDLGTFNRIPVLPRLKVSI